MGYGILVFPRGAAVGSEVVIVVPLFVLLAVIRFLFVWGFLIFFFQCVGACDDFLFEVVLSGICKVQEMVPQFF